MAKNNNKPAAPAAKKPEVETATTQKPIQVLDMNSFIENVGKASQEGLDPNRRVDLLRIMHETFRVDKDAATKYNMPEGVVNKINELTAAGMIHALASEITFGKNPFAITMNRTQLDTLNEVGTLMGVSFNLKALPAPDKDGNVTVNSDQIKVSKDAKNQIEEEAAIKEEAPCTDPTKIETEEDLKKALLYIMTSRPGAYQKIDEAVNFYQAYLKIQANKSENKDEELKNINELSRIQLIARMSTILDRCPYVLNGFGRHMATITSITKSPISAFCMFRNTTKNKKTGEPALSDEVVAEYVTAIITWAVNVNIAEVKNLIVKEEENIKVLSKDKKSEKANAKAIEAAKAKIEKHNETLVHFNNILEYVTMPSGEVAENLLQLVIEKDQTANRIFKSIAETYYTDVDATTVDAGVYKNNVKLYAGIITNLFRDPGTPLKGYSKADIVELETKPAEEESEESKNS